MATSRESEDDTRKEARTKTDSTEQAIRTKISGISVRKIEDALKKGDEIPVPSIGVILRRLPKEE